MSLATPTAISAVLGRLQSLGLMVKRAQAIEALDRVTHVVFDKTGTLTSGQPVLAKILCDDSLAHEKYLNIAASLEFYSEHPLARALVKAADITDYLLADNVVNQTGGGLTGYIDGLQYAIGSVEHIEQFSAGAVDHDWLRQVGIMSATAVVLASRDSILCLFVFTDNIRSDAASLVTSIKADARKVILMTGDGEAAASRVAVEVGIDEYHARLLPEDKMSQVQALQDNGAVVLMVGDGLNDAPVLSNADVSIAMGSSSSLAKTSADIVMLANRLGSILDVLRLASKTQVIIKQNLGWALAYNVCAIPAAASGFITPWMAAIGMSLSSLIVVLNALRLTAGHGNKY
ncbi:MAG: cation-translocating P-type ATPase [Gammaproteobacteria bacterium]|nr:cation-translocating P-type ATPase [Gammaproteobacteria bacterium]